MAKLFLKYRIKNWLKKNKCTRETISYRSANRIGVLFSIDSLVDTDTLNKIHNFIKKIKSENKEVNSLVFLSYDDQTIIDHPYFTKKNISFWGNYTAQSVTSFINQPFDYLFHVGKHTHLEIKGILAQCKAKCRVGLFNKDDEAFFELMINPDDNDFITELYYYTSKLN